MYASIAFVRPNPESRIVEFVVCSRIYLPTPLPFQLQLNEKKSPRDVAARSISDGVHAKNKRKKKQKWKTFGSKLVLTANLTLD